MLLLMVEFETLTWRVPPGAGSVTMAAVPIRAICEPMTVTRKLTAAFALPAANAVAGERQHAVAQARVDGVVEDHGGRAARPGVDAMLDVRVVDDEADPRGVVRPGPVDGDAGAALAQEAVVDEDLDGFRRAGVDAGARVLREVVDRCLLDVDGASVLDVDAHERQRRRARDAHDVETAQRDLRRCRPR